MNMYAKRCQDIQDLSRFIANLAYQQDVKITNIECHNNQFAVSYTADYERY